MIRLALCLPAFAPLFAAGEEAGSPADRLVPSASVPGLAAPAGCEVKVFADPGGQAPGSPAALCVDEAGRVFLAEIRPEGAAGQRRIYETRGSTMPSGGKRGSSVTIRILAGNDGGGMADHSRLFAEGIDALPAGSTAGMEALDGSIYMACAPHLWRLPDADGDGIADRRESLLHGFGTCSSSARHAMGGLALGPAGRLHATLGDSGMEVTTRDGRTSACPDKGAVVRFDRDGSSFEIVHTGLHDPGGIAFDEFGNAFTVDDDSGRGDRPRVVYIVEGGDSGWRSDQGALHDSHRDIARAGRPLNQWMQEGQWKRLHGTQPAFLLPPVAHLASNPAGLAFAPGTGVSRLCENSFLVCDAREEAASSGIRSFQTEPAGAGMRMLNDRQLLRGTTAVDAAFGYDGRLYLAEAAGKMSPPAGGRVLALSVLDTGAGANPIPDTAAIFQQGFASQSSERLAALMAHDDARVRLRAQIELASRPEALSSFVNATRALAEPITRLHGVWGLWMLARQQASVEAANRLTGLLADPDPEIRAQSARALGEAPLQDPALLAHSLKDESNRVRFFAALSLGRLRAASTFNDLVVLLGENADRDVYLRHAGVMGLLGAGDKSRIASLLDNPHRSIRLAAVLALRRLQSPALVKALFDKDPFIADEAIRAVHDVPIEDARPAVAALLDEYASGQQGRPLSRIMLRRLVHSASRVGGDENAARLLRIAANPALDKTDRLEALRLVAMWNDPAPANRSPGRPDPMPKHTTALSKSILEAELPPLLKMDGKFLTAAVRLAACHDVEVRSPNQNGLRRILRNPKLDPATRKKALDLWTALEPENLADTLRELVQSEEDSIAIPTLELLANAAPKEALGALRNAIRSPSLRRRQHAWKTLRAMPGNDPAKIIAKGLDHLTLGEEDPAVAIEILEAAAQRPEAAVRKARADYKSSLPAGDPFASYRVCLAGGDPKRGESIFLNHPAAQCGSCHRAGAGNDPEHPLPATGPAAATTGPNLAGTGRRLTRRQILDSLLAPNAAIAPGFASLSIRLVNNSTFSGMLVEENEDHLKLLQDGTLWRIRKIDIRRRTSPVSTMPPMAPLLNRREIRDLIAWLVSLPDGERGTPFHGVARPLDPILPPSQRNP